MLDKSALRKELLGRRDQIPPEVRKAKSILIQERLLSLGEFIKSDIIFFFASFKTEVDTAGLIKTALSSGKRVVLPKVDKDRHELLLIEIKDFSELQPGYMGILEPPLQDNQMSININDVNLVIIPGAGFDVLGNRIGYGGGYYDRLLFGLQKHIPVIAPAYEEQLVDYVPSEPHDIKVQMIVTDRQLIRCGAQQ